MNHGSAVLLAVAAASLGAPAALAQEITLSAEHEEYYFLVGEPAVFQIQVNSTYPDPVAGSLVSKIEHIDDSLGVQFSNSNSEFSTLSPGLSGIDVNLGSHEAPTSFSVDVLFSYVEQSAKLVDLDPIIVHIVDSASPDRQDSGPISASSQEANIPPAQQSSQASGSQDRLQNSQMAQDSAALREEIREQLAQDAESRESVLEAARSSEEFAELDEELRSQGYQMSSAAAEATSESSGEFSFEYTSPDGRTASIEGAVEDGEVAEIGVQTSQELDAALEALRADPRFQELASELEAEGYAEADASITKLPDGSFDAALSYSQTNSTAVAEAQITASIVNGTATDIRAIRDGEQAGTPWALIAAITGLAAAALLGAYYAYRRRRPAQEAPARAPRRARDYAAESARLLDDSESAFAQGQHKDAYALLGRGLRLGLSHKLGIHRELSNADLLAAAGGSDPTLGELRECLDASSLVVFARHGSDAAEFERILAAARRMIT